MIAAGTFEVDLQPIDPFAQGQAGIQFRRMSIVKTFRGDLSADSRGEMLAVMTPVEGSAGYVAAEQVQGTLAGRAGTFVLQHYGISTPAGQRLILEVVPDSATGQLQGLAGKMTIHIEDGQHRYEFDFTLP